VHRGQQRGPREERESLQSTGKRLSRPEGTDAWEGRIDFPRSFEFQVVANKRSSVSSYVQVLGMVPDLEGAPTVNSVIDMGIGERSSGSLYLPR